MVGPDRGISLGKSSEPRGATLKNARTETEVAETLEDVQVTLEVLVAHLGLAEHVQSAIGARRVRAERSRLQAERSRGGADPSGDSRR
jgi:hypothetical protein